MAKSITYKDAGVDIRAGDNLVQSIKSIVKDTHNDSVLSNIGGFGALFRPDFSAYKDPVLVSSVDGVGTKLKVAFMMKRYDTVGQDLVNHCVNDIAVCGAEPLFFLDYFSTGRLEQEVAFEVIRGFTIACKENGCALIGGETAEMPDIYADGEFDLAGTIVGVADKAHLFDGSKVRKGDVLVGIGSSGLHTNGYSLARRALFPHHGVDDYVKELGTTVGEALMFVHKSYLTEIRALKKIEGVHAFSHITGGGIEGNTRRVIPDVLSMAIDYNSWDRPPIFNLIQKTGSVPEEDMRQALNLGIGLVVIVADTAIDDVKEWARSVNTPAHIIGRVV